MTAVFTNVILIMVVTGVNHILSMQVVPERANVANANEKYVTGVKLYIRRYTRRGSYYMNLEGTNKHTFGNNVTLDLVFYEFLHNEYKPSFVQLHYKYCDLVNKNPHIGKALREVGLVCPTPPRAWKLANITIPIDNFPYVWPFEKCRLDISFNTYPEKDHIGELQLYLLMKQKIGK